MADAFVCRIRPWREGYEKHLAPFDALFIDCSDKDVARGATNSHQSYRLMNLPLLNTFLAKKTYELRDDANASIAKQNAEVDHLVQNLCFLGTNRNDEQLSGGAGNGAHPERSSAYRRLINFDCRGASRVRNLWASARQGDRLAFVLVEVPAYSHVKENRPTDSHMSRLADGSKELQLMKAQLQYMLVHNFSDSACNELRQAIKTQQDSERKETKKFVLQCKPVVLRDGGNINDMLEPHEKLRKVMDVGFVYEHVPRAFSPSVGSAKAALTTFSGNDALPVISIFMRV